MSRSAHPMASRLRVMAKLVAPASVPGALYNFGYFPAAIFDPYSRRRIYGELHQLNAPQTDFRVLDIYEGCSPGDPHPWLYRRQIVAAQLLSNHSVSAWIYTLIETPHCKVQIATGRYIARNAKLMSGPLKRSD